jgi:hypothetical protein
MAESAHNKFNPIIIVVGAKGTGKTTFVKQKLQTIEGRKLFYDVNNEYGAGIPPAIDDFTAYALTQQNITIVCEEASSFFGSARDMITQQLMTRARHKNLCLFFIFHHLVEVPPYIMRKADFLVLFKTESEGEVDATTLQKFKGHSKVLQAYKEVNLHNDFYYKKIIKLGVI